jgi:hypothetical protein
LLLGIKRIIVSDVSASVHVVRARRSEEPFGNQAPFADAYMSVNACILVNVSAICYVNLAARNVDLAVAVNVCSFAKN